MIVRYLREYVAISSVVGTRYHGHYFLMLKLQVHCRERSTDPAATRMGEMLCRLSEKTESTDDLVDILGCSYQEISLPMLGAAMFERGLLASRYVTIYPTSTVALGDVGYVTETGDFVVVDNVHQSIQADSESLSWSEALRFFSGHKFLGDTPPEFVESQLGKSYHRRRQVHFSICVKLVNILF